MARAARKVQRASTDSDGKLPFHGSLFDAAPLPAAILDGMGQVLAVNRSWEESDFRLLSEHLLEGANFFQQAAKLRLFNEEPAALDGLLEAVGGSRDRWAHELTSERLRLHAAAVHEGDQRGLLLMVEARGEPVMPPDPDSKAEQLESLTALAGGVAHDFNNLLTTMLGYTHLALGDLPLDSPVRDYLTQVDLSARRAADLTQQLLSYAGRNLVPFQQVQINQLVLEMRPLLESVGGRHRLHYSLTEALPLIEADPHQLRQVIINLVTNAVESFESGGFVSIRTGLLKLDSPWTYSAFASGDLTPGPYVYLEVQDTGQGMPPETVNRLFHPFFSTKFTGRGLGMAAVWGSVRSHHGLIKVESELGKGSTFRVLLPAFGK